MIRLLVALAAPSVLAFGFVFAASALVDTNPVAGAVVWGGRAYTGPDEFRGWLAARGVSYETWAKRHPVAAARLEGRPPPAAAGAPRQPERAPRVSLEAVPDLRADRLLPAVALLALVSLAIVRRHAAAALPRLARERKGAARARAVAVPFRRPGGSLHTVSTLLYRSRWEIAYWTFGGTLAIAGALLVAAATS